MNENTIVVIARNDEPLRWTSDLNRPVIVQKGQHLPNIGREASSYLWFIVSNYGLIQSQDFVFCQGDPFPHDKDFVQNIEKDNYYGKWLQCGNDGLPDHNEILNIDPIRKALGLKKQKTYKFKSGACFKVSAEEIKQRPLSFYAKALALSLEAEKAPWVFERLWGYIFPSLLAEYEHN